jgi:hypothetical protein
MSATSDTPVTPTVTTRSRPLLPVASGPGKTRSRLQTRTPSPTTVRPAATLVLSSAAPTAAKAAVSA